MYLKLSLCGMIAAAYGCGLWLSPFSVFTFAAGIPVCIWLVSVCHELGHLLAYRLLGLSWKRLAVSVLVWEKGTGLRVDAQRRFFAASCTCTYQPHIPFWKYAVALVSGGLLCLLSGGAAVVVACLTGGALMAFCLCFGAVCGINACYNLLLPFSADRVLIRQIKHEKEKTP